MGGFEVEFEGQMEGWRGQGVVGGIVVQFGGSRHGI